MKGVWLIPAFALLGLAWLHREANKEPPPTVSMIEPVKPVILKPAIQKPIFDARRFAMAESGGRPKARNPNSTASGLYQFTDGTWSLAVGKWGKPLHIRLRDKNKPSAQLAMARKLAEDNARIMRRKLGRPATQAEVYAAHFFGARDVVTLLRMREQAPNRKAASLFSNRVVTKNKAVFYEGKKPRSVRQVCQLLMDKVA